MTDTDYKVGYGKPPPHTRFKKGEPSANPRGRPRKNLAALLVEGLNKTVTVTENGRRRKATVREAVVSQLINKSASADLRATKMVLDIMRDAEKQAAAAPPRRSAPPLHAGRRGGRRPADRTAARPDLVRDDFQRPSLEIRFHHGGTENTENKHYSNVTATFFEQEILPTLENPLCTLCLP